MNDELLEDKLDRMSRQLDKLQVVTADIFSVSTVKTAIMVALGYAITFGTYVVVALSELNHFNTQQGTTIEYIKHDIEGSNAILNRHLESARECKETLIKLEGRIDEK